MNNSIKRPINVALIGYGYAGKIFHAPLITNTSGLNLMAIVSSDRSKVLRDFPYISVSATAKEAYASSEVDLVVIATPNDTHFELAKMALRSGKHVIVDKPFTVTTAQATALFDLAKDTDRVLSVFQNRRWDADFLTVRQLLSEGQLGEIISFHSNFDRYRPQIQQRWREQALPGSGLWYDIGPHLVDQVVTLFGTPDTVFGDLAMQRAGSATTDYFHVLLNYGRTRVILHSSSFVSGNTPRFAIHGTAGSFIKYGFDLQESCLKRDEKIDRINWGIDPQEGMLYKWEGGSLDTKSLSNIPGNYGSYYEAIRDTIQQGVPNPVKSEEVLAVMNILELTSQSANLGQKLTFNKVPMRNLDRMNQIENILEINQNSILA